MLFLKRIFAEPPKDRDQGWLYECPIGWEAGTQSVRKWQGRSLSSPPQATLKSLINRC